MKKFESRTIKNSIERFVSWIQQNGYLSFDQYDFWSTWYGIQAKRLYYHNHFMGTPFVAPVFIAELVMPEVRKLFVSPKRFPIADAHFIMGYVNLFHIMGNDAYLNEAKTIADELVKSNIPGYSGYCWGYPFNWMTNNGLWQKDVPLITTTPYCFAAFLALYDATGDETYLNVARSSAQFAYNDLNETRFSDQSVACSYSPIDHSKVLNANSYRAFMLVEASKRFSKPAYLRKAMENIRFVLDNQAQDGSWLYEIDNPQNAFVDNFHTCFVLKNLFKANIILQDNEIKNVIERGYLYYVEHLFREDGSPIPYAKVNRLNFARHELYDYAEGINLGVLLSSGIDGALERAADLVEKVVHEFQTESGHFFTRVNVTGMKNKIPYLRWPQAQLFFALTTYAKSRMD